LTVHADVEATCAAVARFWRGGHDSTVVRVVDTLVTPWVSDTTVTACFVVVEQEHDVLRRAAPPIDTAAQRLGTALALVRGAGPGWIALSRYAADGPDETSAAYQRGRVRCLVEQEWDGGDDADTTHVATDWFKEQTTCWLTPAAAVVEDPLGTRG
jgi:hypothetical protein